MDYGFNSKFHFVPKFSLAEVSSRGILCIRLLHIYSEHIGFLMLVSCPLRFLKPFEIKHIRSVFVYLVSCHLSLECTLIFLPIKSVLF